MTEEFLLVLSARSLCSDLRISKAGPLAKVLSAIVRSNTAMASATVSSDWSTTDCSVPSRMKEPSQLQGPKLLVTPDMKSERFLIGSVEDRSSRCLLFAFLGLEAVC